MNDALKDPLRNLILKLDWPNDHDQLVDGQRVVVDLQNTNGITFAMMSLPIDQLLKAVSQKLKCYPLTSPDGFVSVVSDEVALFQLENRTIALDQLVADAVSPEMLEDEPEAAHMLSEFRVRLLKSLEHVDKAIASLPKT
jgi:hypothetical protein